MRPARKISWLALAGCGQSRTFAGLIQDNGALSLLASATAGHLFDFSRDCSPDVTSGEFFFARRECLWHARRADSNKSSIFVLPEGLQRLAGGGLNRQVGPRRPRVVPERARHGLAQKSPAVAVPPGIFLVEAGVDFPKHPRPPPRCARGRGAARHKLTGSRPKWGLLPWPPTPCCLSCRSPRASPPSARTSACS